MMGTYGFQVGEGNNALEIEKERNLERKLEGRAIM